MSKRGIFWLCYIFILCFIMYQIPWIIPFMFLSAMITSYLVVKPPRLERLLLSLKHVKMLIFKW